MAADNERVCDLGNPLLAPQAFRLDLGMATDEEGTVRGVVTTRTASTSLTVYPTPDQLREQAKLLNALADKIEQGSTQLMMPHPALIQAINGQRPR